MANTRTCACVGSGRCGKHRSRVEARNGLERWRLRWDGVAQLLALGAIDEQGELSAQVTRAMRTRERMHSLSMRLMRMRTRAARDDDTRVAPG